VKVCKKPGCEKPARAGGYCHSHYQAQWRKRLGPCRYSGCTNKEKSGGYCQRHSLIVRGLDPGKGRVCTADGCQRPADATAQYCWRHYRRINRGSDLHIVHGYDTRLGKENHPCAVEGCPEKVGRAGRNQMCPTHAYRVKKYGDPHTFKRSDHLHPYSSARCSVPGCNRVKLVRGMCQLHYSRQQRGAPLDTPVNRKRYSEAQQDRPCSLASCADPTYAKGLCKYHYKVERRKRWHAIAAERNLQKNEINQDASPTPSASVP
jgi:hypothetical protein